MTKKRKTECEKNLTTFVLVGTYRKDNAEWIKEKKLYNLPLPSCGKTAFHEKISQIVLIAEGFVSIAFEAKFKEVVDAAWLKENGYKVAAADKAHGTSYALYELGEKVAVATALANPVADVFVASQRCPSVKIDAAFYAKPYPKTGGKSMPYIFDKLKPYFKKWHSATTFNPVQGDFFQIMFPDRRFPALPPLDYKKNGIKNSNNASRNAVRRFRMGEFFCGPGGLACGALSAKIENENFSVVHAWSNDYDQDTCNTYAQNVCHDNPETVICHDVRTLDLNDPRLTPIDGFSFGFPCNDFSVVGEHKGFDGNYGPLYQYGIAVLKKFQPLWFVAENVGGLASANEGVAFKRILGSMKDAGYRIYPHLYKFEEYGVPQSRHRIIIIGIRKDQSYVFNPHLPNHGTLKGMKNVA